MKTRLLLAPVLIVAFIALMYLDNRLGRPYAFTTLAGFAMIGCIFEVAHMLKVRGIDVDRGAVVLTGVGMLVLLLSNADLNPVTALTVIAVMGAFLAVIAGMRNVWNADVKAFMTQYSGTLMLYMYVVLPVGSVVALRLMPVAGEWLVYWLIAVCKLADSGAYFTGKAFGRYKLIEHVSPNKTVEGLIGGLLVALLTGLAFWLLAPALQNAFEVYEMLLLSLLVGIVSAHGDLVASAFKRGAGMKDSGRLLPEFGGVLDLVDNFMLAGPMALIVIYFYS